MRIRTVPAAAAVIALLLAGCTPTGDDEPTPTATAPDPAVTTTPAPEETAAGFPDDGRGNVRDAVITGNTAAIEGYLTDPVDVILYATECCGPIAPSEAIGNLGILASSSGWDFDLPDATVAGWAADPGYGVYFTGSPIVGQASDGTIVAFHIEGAQIDGIWVGAEVAFSG